MVNLMESKQKALDTLNLVMAALLFLSPWVLNFADVRAPAWNAWLSAVAIGAVALAAILAFAEWEEWINLVLGAWVVVSPWLLGFSDVAGAFWAHLVLGLIVAALAAGEIWRTRQSPPKVTA